MKSNLLFYLSAGFNVGALSTVIVRLAKSNFLTSRKEMATLVLSSLAAVSSVGYLLSNKDSKESVENDFIDTEKDTVHKLETFLI